MSEKLNKTGLAYFYNRIKGVFATQDSLNTLSTRVEEIISEGGEPNVIEVIKKNNVTLPVTGKAVNVEIPTKLSEFTNDGDGTTGSKFATEKYVGDNGGKIDSIKVNGTTQVISNKTVDITVPEDLTDLTNTDADPFARISDVEAAHVGALKPKGSVAFANLPALEAKNLNCMYSVTDAFVTTANFIEGAGHSHVAGTNVAIVNVGTDEAPVYKYDAMTGVVDMSGYWSKTELVDITTAEIDAIIDSPTP